MEHNICYLPIYNFGDDPDGIHGTSYGTQLYNDLQMLSCYEPEAVGYIEVEVNPPTENEFKRKHGLKSDAV